MKPLIRKTALLAAALAVLAASAAAAEQTRETYVAEVEPICKVNKQVSDRYLKGVKTLVKNNKLTQASRNFTKAAAALEKAQKQLAVVPVPVADGPKIAKWLLGIQGEVSLMKQIAAKLKQGDKGKASSLAIKLQHNATATNNLVIAFAFDYCKIDPSKYT